MPREMCYRCFWCKTQIDHGSRKYSISGSLLLRVFQRRTLEDESALTTRSAGLVVDGMIVGD